ncbi:HAD-superfamily hydrolase [Neoconidiobolus thromboides FSU 785]|nr:HAD-superfamily hydrolase [Neoconidiobolus thromboides FSU 785]
MTFSETNDYNDIQLNPKSLKNVYFSDEAKVKQKVANILQDGANKLHIISDFDMTISKFWVNGDRNVGSHAVLTKTGIVSDKFKENEKALFEKYYPFEISQTLSYEEKYQKMVEWWTLVHQAFIDEKLTYQAIKEGLDTFNMVYRDGSNDFFKLANQKGLPLIVFSAGLADIIEILLQNKGYLNDNVHVVSNSMIFDTKEPKNIIDFKEPLIHVLSKGVIKFEGMKFYNEIENRSNGLLLGDSLGDVCMKGGLNHNNLLTIGFLNYDVENLLPKYLDKFDVVIAADDSMEWVNDLLEKLN